MIIPKVMSQHGLRSFLREVSSISERLTQLKLSSTTANIDDSYAVETEMLTERARRLVSTLTLDMLGAVLPDRLGLASLTAPMYYIDIYESEHIHACLFGFKSCDFHFPLHDHPDMYGFVKVLRGAVSINSYTELSYDEREALKRTKSNTVSSTVTIARFEGISNRWHSDDCVYLGPKFGNIHSLIPLEEGTAFFDLLMPGYGKKPCTYFKNVIQNPKLKQACSLQKIAEPQDYYCQLLPYEKIRAL
uniref:2-aminoethanethiol dioxygenase n=1 Tax=Elaeophora elaphi TaxID=1147741 RepID=A0A0R3RVW0_9BILA